MISTRRVLGALLLVPFAGLACATPEAKCAPSSSVSEADRAAASAPAAAPPARDPAEIKLERYSLVILRRGPAWTPEVTPASTELQKQHIGHLQAMGKSGKLVVAGPFDDQADETMRGMCLYRTPLEEARSLAESDPAVKAGRLKVEVLTWYTEKGALAFPWSEKASKQP